MNLPNDIHGIPVQLGPWYWARGRTGQVVGAGKFLATISCSQCHFYINGTGYDAGTFDYWLASSPEAEQSRVAFRDSLAKANDNLVAANVQHVDRIAELEKQLALASEAAHEAEGQLSEAKTELEMWKPLTPEEAEAAIATIEAEPLTYEEEQRIEQIVAEVTKNGPDPTWRPPEPWYVQMAGYCRRLKSWLDAIRVAVANEGQGDLEHMLATTALGRVTTLIGRSRLKQLCDAETQLANRNLIEAIALRREGDDAVVSVERGGQWVEVIREPCGACFSHIIEPAGIRTAIEAAADTQSMDDLAASGGIAGAP